MTGEWKPIETAPRDGTCVLIYGGTIESDLGNAYPNDDVVKACFDESYSHGEWDVSDTCYYSVTVKNPTHWMPLPPSPSAKDKT